MTPETRQAKLLQLQIDQCRAHVQLLKRMALATGYLREDLARQIIGPCETFTRAIDFIEPDQIGVPGLRALRKRAAGR